ncbi:GL22700 [Drosophila persimilis]|uniref:GL22700 n=1 Tax=Drosophila persimilis TaxID=7234 RepID=B4GZX1_DROPE|nr:GL22700 [Drosophila persimilis]
MVQNVSQYYFVCECICAANMKISASSAQRVLQSHAICGAVDQGCFFQSREGVALLSLHKEQQG